MGISNILSYLSPGLTTAAEGIGQTKQAQAGYAQQRLQQLMEIMQLQRQQALMGSTLGLNKAHQDYFNAAAKLRGVQSGDAPVAPQPSAEDANGEPISPLPSPQGPGAASPPGAVQPKVPPRNPGEPLAVYQIRLKAALAAAKPDATATHATNRLFDVAHPVPQAESFVPASTTGAGGEAQLQPFSKKTGQLGPVIGTPKQTLRIESAQNTAAQARLTAAVSEMNNAHGNMSDYEAQLASGKANISGLQQFAGSIANTFTHDDPVSKLAQTQALAILNRTNPDLARYIRRGLSFAEGESMISQRPSDFRTRMAAFLSQAASGASPEMIADIQSRRNAILGPLNETVGTSKPAGPPQRRANDPAAWIKANPPRPGETTEAYKARYQKAVGPIDLSGDKSE